jgi:hypothetical protein
MPAEAFPSLRSNHPQGLIPVVRVGRTGLSPHHFPPDGMFNDIGIDAAVVFLTDGKPSVGLDLLHSLSPIRTDSRQKHTAGAIPEVSCSALKQLIDGELRWIGGMENQFAGIIWRRFHLQPLESGSHIEFSGMEHAGVGNRNHFQRGYLIKG